MPREFIYRSAELELDRLGQQHGWVPTAKREAIEHHSKFFKRVDGDLIHMETGEAIEEWAAKQKTQRPHWFLPDEVVDTVEAAIGGGPKSRVRLDERMRLFREVGESQYNLLLAQWGATASKNGTRPLPESEATVDRAKAAKTATDNPWSKDGWNVTKQGSLIKSLGFEAAQSIARSQNSFIGATRPAS